MPARREIKKGEEKRKFLVKENPERKALILEKLAEGWSVGAAAGAAGVSRNTAFNWRDRDPEFAAAWAEAMERGVDVLEDEAYRRAVVGVNEPLTHQGHFTYARDEATGELLRGRDGNPVPLTIKRYSDNLLIMMLRGRRPERYAEKRGVGVSLTQGEGGDRTLQIEFVESS